MYRNAYHIPLPQLREMYWRYVDTLGDWHVQAQNPHIQQLDTFFENINDTSFKIIHPLLFKGYKSPMIRHSEKPVTVTGLDIETNAETGEPMMMGFWYPAPDNRYHVIYHPKLSDFFSVIRGLVNNSSSPHLIVWGTLDIQCIIRLFEPTESERERLSRGLSGRISKGKIVAQPPIMREISKRKIFVSHYMPGRSLKIGFMAGERDYTIWIFNCSQFYPSKISESAKGLSLPWKDFPRDTHIIDWAKYSRNESYRQAVLASNEQDARTVTLLAESLQQRFHEVFECYPALLVSAGSLTDAVVSKMLSRSDYASNSWAWLSRNIWQDHGRKTLAHAESLLAEAFSAGYVDQFAVGYFDELHTADIAAAYPHKIRSLPDLRYSRLFVGSGDLSAALESIRNKGWEIETAIIRGRVQIPNSLPYHPITVKTSRRHNYRPTGTFQAAYTLEEKEFCLSYGARFDNEDFVIVALSERKPAPIATVSTRLGEMRSALLSELAQTTNTDRRALLDGQQYIVKVVDNSVYGKTVMTTEIVEDIDGSPQITGYYTGDRFNQLYGTLITARTRIQLASACMDILKAGGTPVMCMTDSIYWQGRIENLPSELIRAEKTPGYFEPPVTVRNMYLLKTGQYEFLARDHCASCKGRNKYHYKMRGLNIDREQLDGNQSFYHKLVTESLTRTDAKTHPADILIPVTTRRLMSIGRRDLTLLGAIVSGTTELRPFVLTGKSAGQYIMRWRECLDSHVWLSPIHERERVQTYPLSFLSELFESGTGEYVDGINETTRARRRRSMNRLNDMKARYILRASLLTGKRPAQRSNWEALLEYYGIER